MVGVGVLALGLAGMSCSSRSSEPADGADSGERRSAGTPDGVAGLPEPVTEVATEATPQPEPVPVLTGRARHEYTSVTLLEDCTRLDPPSPDEPDLGGEFDCPGFGKYDVRVATADVRSVLSLVREGREIHFASDPEYSEPGQFAYVTDKVVEWRFREADGERHAHALLFRIHGQDPDTFEDVSHLIVARLEGTRGCVLGTTRSNEEAREMADDVELRCP